MEKKFSAVALLGTDVVNAHEVSLGTVEDFIINLPQQQIEYIILSSGGYLGMDDKLFAIHSSFFHLNGDDESLVFEADMGRKDGNPLIELPEHYDELEVLSVHHFIQLITSFIEQPGHRSDFTEY